MFDIGWAEMGVVAVIALLVIGPKELPRTMRTVAHWFGKARGLAREFQSGLDDIVREADLDDARTALNATRDFSPNKIIADTVDPTGSMTDEIKDVEKTAKSDAGSDAGGTAQDGASQNDGPKATIVKQPAQVAPAHSVTPPEESVADTATEAVVEPVSAAKVPDPGSDSSKQSA
ncbi:Sec-independent protein translocase protein TatB [Pelagibius sp. Alg239-R121]|uniref:Sec-independent protein translocase protein TatB n=1 Tax=Pelagibius sp. Alg239-R121 TaxID=2993448 RepID=UPI0024A61B83|nr:Sec-independent protein translocase protein TatB [Pelagibius sp. Alg239-R121]